MNDIEDLGEHGRMMAVSDTGSGSVHTIRLAENRN